MQYGFLTYFFLFYKLDTRFKLERSPPPPPRLPSPFTFFSLQLRFSESDTTVGRVSELAVLTLLSLVFSLCSQPSLSLMCMLQHLSEAQGGGFLKSRPNLTLKSPKFPPSSSMITAPFPRKRKNQEAEFNSRP